MLLRVYAWEESERFRRMGSRGSGVRVSLAPLTFPWYSLGFLILGFSLGRLCASIYSNYFVFLLSQAR
ncbi:hypothetical protein PMIT1312_00138 [Prochlorococcus marinus str. MIT 1312]|nr:hypothetical protein PMIT1312_00138 [Prochlorococcus marinus str. MIT 1312]